MRKLLTILFSIISFTVVAQKPVQTLGNKFNRVKVLGEFQSDSAIVFPNDTIHLSPTDRALAFKGTKIYKWDGTKWGVLGDGVNGSVLNDSTLLLCNSGGCDTFTVHLVINNFSFTSDSTVRVCDASGVCDTINFNPTPLAKFYVDSVIIHNGANLDTLYYYINGNAIVGGYIGGRYYNKDQIDSIFTVTLQNYYTTTQIDSINIVGNNESNHIISGGIVTYSGSGLTYYISGCTYLIGGVVYNSPDTTITLDAADATNPRIDLFAVDTLGRALKITGTAASTPITPQVDPASQLTLTTGITLEANATTPTGTTSTLIYDENTEWTTGGTATVNYNNTANPYHGTKDALVSYTKNQTLTFSGTTQTVNGQVLRAFIYLNNANYSFQFQLFNGTTAVSNLLTLNGFGFNPTLYNTYQNVSIPLTAFTWSGTNFDKLVITMTGKGSTGTYYLDYVSLEGGTPVPPQIDYSNKVDSVKMRNDSIFYVIKGVYYYSGFNAYQRSQTDSITAQLRSEIVSAAGGGVISFNGRNGAVVPDSTDYYTFYYTRHLVDSLLGLKENISDAFSGSYNDLTDKPVTVTNLSLGTVTSTSQAINNSNGTGVTLPSASISTAGLMTAGDKVLVNTITSKLAIADTAAMLSHYLRKTDAFTKAQADLLYRPITYVPSWSEITGKPTFATVATTGSYNDLIDKPTIPTNNNQLTNGAGYITGLDTMSLIHTYDSTLYTTPYKSGLKVDSVTRISGSYYYWTKGVKHLISVATDSSSYHTLGQAPDSTYFTIGKPDGTVDTVRFVADTTAGSGSSYTASSGIVLQGSNFKLQDTLDGAATKIIWMPSKSAFRAGYASGTQWDVGNIGNYSISMGRNGIASANDAIALGIGSSATGNQDVAIQGGTASGGASISVGQGTKSLGVSSTALGYHSESRLPSSTTLGVFLINKHSQGTVIGSFNDTTDAANPTGFSPLNKAFQVGIGSGGSPGIGARGNGLEILFNGKVTFPWYGSGAFTGTPSKQLSVTSTGDIIETSQPIITSGTAAPSSTPQKVGDIYVDITNKKLYFSTGTSSSADWTIAN